MTGTEKRCLFEVTHPIFGIARVEAVDTEEATLAAAREWDEPWREIACDCRVKKLGTAQTPKCKRCGREYVSGRGSAGFCGECVEILARQRQAARSLEQDRRAGMRRR